MQYNYIEAIILGIIEGITEFIPVSSTGHLIIASEFLGFNQQINDSFNIFIQLGAILAVVYLYRLRFRELFYFKSSSGFTGIKGISLLALSCLPAFVLGAIFHSKIKAVLFNSKSVAIALIVGGILMIWFEKRKTRIRTISLDHLSYKQALTIGIIQVLSLWPGMSRSASTIIGGLFAGLDRKIAAEYSFLLAVPIIFGAVCYDLLINNSVLNFEVLPLFAVGSLVAFFVGIIAIKTFITLLTKFTLIPFALYRILLGVIVLLIKQ